MADAVHYVVIRTPIDPYTYYEENKDELRAGYHPAEFHRVECSFRREEDAAAFCDTKNVELYVDTYWKTKLNRKERAACQKAIDSVEDDPMGSRMAFLRAAATLLQAKLTEDIARVVENSSGGYSYCSVEHYR